MKKYSNIDEYIVGFPKNVQKVLKLMRRTIKKTAPKATEGISYSIPTFYLNGKYIVYMAGFKNHTSIYPVPRGESSFEKELSKYKGGKGTAQFPLDKPLPIGLIQRIVKYRVKQRLLE